MRSYIQGRHAPRSRQRGGRWMCCSVRVPILRITFHVHLGRRIRRDVRNPTRRGRGAGRPVNARTLLCRTAPRTGRGSEHSEVGGGGEGRILAFFDDIYVVCPSPRVAPIFKTLTAALWTHARIQVHLRKTQFWNKSGENDAKGLWKQTPLQSFGKVTLPSQSSSRA